MGFSLIMMEIEEYRTMTPMSYGGIHMGVEVLIWEWRCPYGIGGAYMGVEVLIWEWRCWNGSRGAEMGVEATISYTKLGLFWNQKVKCTKSEWDFDQPLLSPTSASSIITHLNIPYYRPSYHPSESPLSSLTGDWCPNDVIPPIFTHEEARNE